jgi:GH15 family glucan-1,4-alpha-glucosidase
MSTRLDLIYQKSLEVLKQAVLPSGGTAPSFKGSRYAGKVYPRDHAYTTLGLISAGMLPEAQKALSFILNVSLSDKGVLFQRYNEQGENSSNKPPQIDGNGLNLIALEAYFAKTNDVEFVKKHRTKIDSLINGLEHNIDHFAEGSLAYAINGINEFPPIEEGYDLYTNACTYKGLAEIAPLYQTVFGEEKRATELTALAEKVKNGMSEFLYFPEYKTFVTLVRKDPNSSVARVANLTGFLALADFDIFPLDDERMKNSLTFHLEGTKNEEMGTYNRYAESIGRHNYGNGPWPMVIIRLVHCYVKMGKKAEAQQLLDWIAKVAEQNEDVPNGLPEHVTSKQTFDTEYQVFKRINKVVPHPDKDLQYQSVINSKLYQNKNLAYPVNPLVWSHAMFVIVWNEIKNRIDPEI